MQPISPLPSQLREFSCHANFSSSAVSFPPSCRDLDVCSLTHRGGTQGDEAPIRPTAIRWEAAINYFHFLCSSSKAFSMVIFLPQGSMFHSPFPHTKR